MNITFQKSTASPLLSNVVDYYWHLQEAEKTFLHTSIPTGIVEMIIHLNPHRTECLVKDQWQSFPEVCFLRVSAQPMLWNIPAGTALLGICFTPEGFTRLFGTKVTILKNSFIDATHLFDNQPLEHIIRIQQISDQKEKVKLLDIMLLNQFDTKQKQPGDYFSQAVEIIKNGSPVMSVDQLCKMVCISERQLQRIFKTYLGISPKHYLQIVRFQKAYQCLQTKPVESLAGLAYEFGFADQAHFTRDFKKFCGKTPKETFFQSRGQN